MYNFTRFNLAQLVDTGCSRYNSRYSFYEDLPIYGTTRSKESDREFCTCAAASNILTLVTRMHILLDVRATL